MCFNGGRVGEGLCLAEEEIKMVVSFRSLLGSVIQKDGKLDMEIDERRLSEYFRRR